jgi:hypothetical protein
MARGGLVRRMTSREELTAEEEQTLERIIDRTSVQAVLESMSIVCGKKAEHLLTNWQDKTTARVWQKAEGAIGLFLCDSNIVEVSR